MTAVTGYRLQCSPMGRLSGFHVASGPAGTVELLVLPKVWADDPSVRWSANAVRWDADQDTLRLVVPEVSTLTVFTDDDDRLALLASIGVDSVRRRQVRRTAATSADVNAIDPDNASADAALDELADEDEEAGPLVTATPVTRVAPTMNLTGTDAAVTADDVAEGLGALATLGIATDLLDLPATDLAPDRFSRVGRALLPIVHRRFVDEVGRQLRWSRRGYRPQTAVLAAVRGRIHDPSVVRHRATGLPELTCTFNEFNRQTPLLTLVATALEEVASRSGGANASFVRSTVHRAVSLRRHLADVAAVAPQEAVREGLGLRLDRLTHRWEHARLLALACLTQRVDALDRQRRVREVIHVELSLNTAKVWEQVLLQALAGVDGWLAVDGNAITNRDLRSEGWSIPPPWAGLGAVRRPDLLLRTVGSPPARTAVIDAKYKVGVARIEAADANQMYVYSHLVSWRDPTTSDPERAVDVAAVALPSPTAARGSTSHPRNGSAPGSIDLWHWFLPFPDLSASATGEIDLESLRGDLAIALGILSSPNSGRAAGALAS